MSTPVRGRMLAAAAIVTAGLLTGFLAAPAQAAPAPAGQLTVLTQNQFVGADLDRILQPASTEQPTYQTALRATLARIASNRFDKRVRAQARQIKQANPDVVALQEVFDLTRDGAHDNGAFRDHLADTMAALGKIGAKYRVAERTRTLDVTIPADLDNNGSLEAQVRLVDHNVILVRQGVATTPVPFSSQCARPSRDGGPGCLFANAAFGNTPQGRVALEHGYVGVDLTVNAREYRVVTTRMERRDVQPADPLSPIFQARQTIELLDRLSTAQHGNRIQIVLGDFAARPEDEAILVGEIPVTPPHLTIRGSGFGDLLTPNFLGTPIPPGRKTCCQREDLRLLPSRLDRQHDAIFLSHVPSSFQVRLLGTSVVDWLLGGQRWPSDHAAAVAKLQLAPTPAPMPRP